MNIVAIVVAYNTPELISESISSFRRFYKDIPIVIVDGSPTGSPCYIETGSIARRFQRVKSIHACRNLGHGGGLNLGIRHTHQENIIIFDSDTELKKPGIEQMLMMFDEKTYGVGQVVKVNENGVNAKIGIDYLHPHFAIIKRNMYNRFHKFINHGAPLIKTMQDISARPNVKVHDFNVSHFVLHKERGTVNVIQQERESQLKGSF